MVDLKQGRMKLFNVEIKDFYDASCDGRIETSYTRLVFANNKDEAIDFVNDNLEDIHANTGVAITALEIDSTKGNLKRKPQYYTIT